MERIIEISDLVKTYQDSVVINGLELSIPSGNIFGLIGPNGAGKSTLIGILTGILGFDSGTITIDGIQLNEKNEVEIKSRIATVLQPPLLFEHFSSYDFLTYVCDMYGVTDENLQDKITSLLDYLGILEFEYAKINKLSSGSRKKLSFCAAVLTQPKILFLDEPFESIDVISIGRMKNILRKLKQNGVTVIITSHILEIVENLCDDIAILHRGNIIAYLDSQTRKELQKDASLSEIFEHYVDVEYPRHDSLNWL